ncbi:MAG: S8 family serine peptidase [Elusimicrobiota bacterium]
MITNIIKSKKDICIVLALVKLMFFLSPAIASGQYLPPTEYKKDIHPKMESHVYRLYKTYYYEGIEKAKEFAQKREIYMEGDLVQVVFETHPDHSNKVRSATRMMEQKIESLGGKVQTTARNLVQSLAPVSALKELADFEGLKYVRLPIRPVPSAITSEGVSKTGADLCAPSGVSTWTYGLKSFYGTSASAPHFAGAIALLDGKTPYSLDQIVDILYGKAKDLGKIGMDNKFGIGRLKVKK